MGKCALQVTLKIMVSFTSDLSAILQIRIVSFLESAPREMNNITSKYKVH
jgi:hypothetical protein